MTNTNSIVDEQRWTKTRATGNTGCERDRTSLTYPVVNTPSPVFDLWGKNGNHANNRPGGQDGQQCGRHYQMLSNDELFYGGEKGGNQQTTHQRYEDRTLFSFLADVALTVLRPSVAVVVVCRLLCAS